MTNWRRLWILFWSIWLKIKAIVCVIIMAWNSIVNRPLATSCEILVASANFLVALATRKVQFRTQLFQNFWNDCGDPYSQSSGGPRWLKNWTNGQNNTTCLLVGLTRQKMTFLKFSYEFPAFWLLRTFSKQGKICNFLSFQIIIEVSMNEIIPSSIFILLKCL